MIDSRPGTPVKLRVFRQLQNLLTMDILIADTEYDVLSVGFEIVIFPAVPFYQKKPY